MWLIRNELDKPSVVHGELDIGHGGQIPIVGYHHKGLLKLIAKGEERTFMKFLLVFESRFPDGSSARITLG